MTVGSGIGPDLLTLRHDRRRSRARRQRWWTLRTYRRWGISPRPEDVDLCLPANRRGDSTIGASGDGQTLHSISCL